jgi:FtsP/CotA-like multicopper oxidase with cupredoxin domain
MVCLRPRIVLFALTASIALGAFAQTGGQMGDCPFDRPLVEPPVIDAVGGKLETTLTLHMASVSVPNWRNVAPFGQPPVYQCGMTKMNLRQYSWPFPGGVASGFPGPTLRVRKASSRQTSGDSLTVHLVNELPIEPNDQCNVGCDCSDPNPKNRPRCCTAPDVFPACFHGDNNTNLHFHGTHVSPQPPQDYVLLELRPKGASTESAGTHEHGEVRSGSYDYVVDPFRYRQPEGTHWYHPHKHGSTALQVGNGLAGALIIEGKFDDDLRALYGGALKEHLLVLQLIHDLNFTTSDTATTQPLINGQPSPVIDMYPGEIRRLRFLSATMQADGAVTIDWNGPQDDAVDVRQIAFDGIQFAPENYDRQPLLSATREVDLAPGNRADFLVKAPMAAGTYDVTYILKVPEAGAGGGDTNLKAVMQAIAPGSAEPRLFRIRVTACMDPQACPPMSFPKVADFPKLPDYLADIPESDVTVRRNLLFELKGPGGGALPPDQIPSQPSKFFINLAPNEERQFNPSCIDITNRLGQTQQWTLYNTSGRQPIKPLHIFHIHTNAFQIINHPLKTKLNTPPYVWADSILLTDSTQPPIVIRTRFEDFTGAYVLHCHFLGHEDRGMMLGVQVVCPDNPSKFGTPAVNGAPDDCRPTALIDALPSCDVFTPRHRGAGH